MEGYIPLLSVATSPSGAGTPYEQVNRLTAKRRQQFSGTANDRTFVLAEQDIESIVSVRVNGVETNQWIEDLAAGTVEFFSPPRAGVSNIEICYKMPSCQRQSVCACCYAALFGSNTDTRVFLWGNGNLPCWRFHSELADGVPSAEYFPENNYTVIGTTRITDIVQQYDRQLIFTPDNAFYSYCDLRTDSQGKVYSSFPVFNLHSTKGNLLSGTGCTVNGKPVTLCRDGLNIWEPTNVENEKNAVCFSLPIANTIRAVADADAFAECRLFDHQSGSELYFAYGDRMYIYQYQLGVWYVYDGIKAKNFCDCFGDLYIIASDNRIYRYNADNKYFTAYWTSVCLFCGSEGWLKDIPELSVTLSATPDTACTVTSYDGENQSGDVRAQTTVDCSGNGVFTRRFRVPLRRVGSVRFRVESSAGHSLHLISVGVTSIRKGATFYGL